MKIDKKIVVLYHNHCDDGFGSAWVAWKKFKDKADYVGVVHNEPPPKNLRGKDVYILDFCYKKNILQELLSTTRELVVIDHHVTAKEAVESVPHHLFEPIIHSGAVLAWQYFFSKKPVPKLLQYIEDVDLWKWKLPHSKELSTRLRVFDFEFKIWNRIARDWENSRRIKKYVKEGVIMLKDENERIKEVVDEAEEVDFCGYKTLVSNSFHFVSQVAAELYKKKPPMAIVWSQRKDKIIVSLRSNGKVDVSKLATKFGGGGHKVAAGFSLELNQKLPWKIIK